MALADGFDGAVVDDLFHRYGLLHSVGEHEHHLAGAVVRWKVNDLSRSTNGRSSTFGV